MDDDVHCLVYSKLDLKVKEMVQWLENVHLGWECENPGCAPVITACVRPGPCCSSDDVAASDDVADVAAAVADVAGVVAAAAVVDLQSRVSTDRQHVASLHDLVPYHAVQVATLRSTLPHVATLPRVATLHHSSRGLDQPSRVMTADEGSASHPVGFGPTYQTESEGWSTTGWSSFSS